MTYFEIFDIPVQLKLTPSALSARFFSLSREFHPDFHTQADEATREEMQCRFFQHFHPGGNAGKIGTAEPGLENISVTR